MEGKNGVLFVGVLGLRPSRKEKLQISKELIVSHADDVFRIDQDVIRPPLEPPSFTALEMLIPTDK